MENVRAVVGMLFLVPLAVVYPLARLPWARLRWILGGPVCFAVLLAPLVIEPDQIKRRWKVALLAFVLWGRGLDYLRKRPSPASRKGGWLRYLLFMTFWPNTMAVSRFLLPLDAPRLAFSLRKTATGFARLAAGSALLVLGGELRLHERWFLLDHTFKLVEVYFIVCGLSDVIVGFVALAGRRVDDLLRDMWKARSLLDFWRRYNVMVHHWMAEHVFERVGGVRRPLLAIFATFIFSGLLHDYLFYAAAPDLLGHQTLFFTLQGVAGLGELWARQRWSIPRRVSRYGAFAFLFATTPIFFLGLDRIYSFHAGGGGWLLRTLGLD